MTGESSLPKRLLELLPVLAAMVFHAITFERWLLVIPTGLVLLAAVLSNVSAGVSMLRAMVAGVIGLTAGVALMMTSVPPPGPMPPLLTSAINWSVARTGNFLCDWPAHPCGVDLLVAARRLVCQRGIVAVSECSH